MLLKPHLPTSWYTWHHCCSFILLWIIRQFTNKAKRKMRKQASKQANTSTHRYFKIAPQDPAASLFDFFGSKEFLVVPACMMRVVQCLARRARKQLSTECAWLWRNILYTRTLQTFTRYTIQTHCASQWYVRDIIVSGNCTHTQVRTHVRMMCYTKGLQQTNASLSQQCDVLQFRSVLSLSLPGNLRTMTSKLQI